MISRGIADRYATALFRSALNAGIAGEVCAEAEAFRKLLAKSDALSNFVLSPQVLLADKQGLLRKALQDKVSPLFMRLLLLLLEKQRFAIVDDILAGYIRLYEKHEGIIEVEVTTAIELDDVMTKKVVAKIEGDCGKTVRLVPRVDPAIIGGVVLRMEDKIIDGSIRYYLEQLRRDLEETRIT